MRGKSQVVGAGHRDAREADRHTGVLREFASRGYEGVDGRSVLGLEWHFVPLQPCGFTSIDPLAPRHGKSLKRACGDSGELAIAWFKARAESGSLRPNWPQDARHPEGVTCRRSDSRRPGRPCPRACRCASGGTSVGLSRGTDSELAVRSPRLSSARAVLRALDRVSGTRTRRPRPPGPRAAWVARRSSCARARGCGERGRGRHLHAHVVRVPRGSVRGGSAAGKASRGSSILRPIAAASCSTRASRNTMR